MSSVKYVFAFPLYVIVTDLLDSYARLSKLALPPVIFRPYTPSFEPLSPLACLPLPSGHLSHLHPLLSLFSILL